MSHVPYESEILFSSYLNLEPEQIHVIHLPGEERVKLLAQGLTPDDIHIFKKSHFKHVLEDKKRTCLDNVLFVILVMATH